MPFIPSAALLQQGGDETWIVIIDPRTQPTSITGYNTFYTWEGGGGAGKNVLIVRYSLVQNDEVAWNVFLGAGTWELEIIGDSGTDRGIGTVTLGSIGTLGTIDAYAASYTTNVSYLITGIVVPARGVYLLKFKQATKNVLSTNYAFALGLVQMRRTA